MLLLAVRRDEDAKPTRVGRLERVQPIFLLIETPKRAFVACVVGLPASHASSEAHGRRHGDGRAMAGRGKTLEG